MDYLAPPEFIAKFDALEKAIREDNTKQMIEIGQRLNTMISETNLQSKYIMREILQLMFLPSNKKWTERNW